MNCQYRIVHRAIGAIDATQEGQDLKANALVVMRPAAAPRSCEIMYAPVTLKKVSAGIYASTTPHGEVKLRLCGIYGAKRPTIIEAKPYLLLLGASGRNARLDEVS